MNYRYMLEFCPTFFLEGRRLPVKTGIAHGSTTLLPLTGLREVTPALNVES